MTIHLSTLEANLRRRIRRHLRTLGFAKNDHGTLVPPGNSKEIVRSLHMQQRQQKLIANKQFIAKQFPTLIKYFASGCDINPQKISPSLQRIASGTWESRLFRLASLTWSIPVSPGFGRRMRYLVWDDSNGKLIGLLALGDPVFNQRARDQEIGWTVKERKERLINVFDAYVLGAVPPYNQLLGGKLVACLSRTREVVKDFADCYESARGIISNQKKNPHLVAVTTASALGRSSVYNRLKLGGQQYFKPIGYTSGWGHFHISDALFADLRSYLRTIEHPYADRHNYGEGPNWRLRTLRVALTNLGLPTNLLRHGIQRELFLCKLASNADDILLGRVDKPNYGGLLRVHEVSELALEKWVLARARRRPEFRDWNRSDFKKLLCRTARRHATPESSARKGV